MNSRPVKIFISGYPQDYDEMALAQLVSPYGQVSTVKIVRDKQSGKAKGYAFVEMISRSAAEEVIVGLNGEAIHDKTLTINIVEENAAAAPVVYRKVERTKAPLKNKRPRRSS